jgi:hypothetical protein
MIPYINPFNPYDSDSESEPNFELDNTDSDTESNKIVVTQLYSQAI